MALITALHTHTHTYLRRNLLQGCCYETHFRRSVTKHQITYILIYDMYTSNWLSLDTRVLVATGPPQFYDLLTFERLMHFVHCGRHPEVKTAAMLPIDTYISHHYNHERAHVVCRFV